LKEKEKEIWSFEKKKKEVVWITTNERNQINERGQGELTT
jgi:hypothetical protein